MPMFVFYWQNFPILALVLGLHRLYALLPSHSLCSLTVDTVQQVYVLKRITQTRDRLIGRALSVGPVQSASVPARKL